MEAVIPIEISLCRTRNTKFSLIANEESMVRQLDLLEKCREAVTIHLADYQQKLAQRYNNDVKTREFDAGDLVLHRAIGSARDFNAGKLAPNWEGPFKVTTITRARAYYLEDMEERPLPWSRNVQNLKKYCH